MKRDEDTNIKASEYEQQKEKDIKDWFSTDIYPIDDTHRSCLLQYIYIYIFII